MSGARTLVVLRHAHAGPGHGVPDAERELSERGIRDARSAARELSVPDHVICSTATRARQTWRLVGSRLSGQPDVTYESRVYTADPETLLDLVRSTGDDVQTLLLVGHNPTVHMFTHALLADQAPASFPPAALAVIEVSGEWSEVDVTRTNLLHAWSPTPH